MQLFTFQKIYRNDDLLTEINEKLKYSTKDVENQWYKYWAEFGEDFIYSSWYLLYKDYIDESLENESLRTVSHIIEPLKKENNKSSPDIEQSDCIVSEIENLSLLDDSQHSSFAYLNKKHSVETEIDLSDLVVEETNINISWDLVWEEHYQEQYKNCFILYNEIYEIAQNQVDEILEIDNSDYDYSDFEKLKALGLPTSFSSTNKNCKKKDKDYYQYWIDDIMESTEEFDYSGLTFNQNIVLNEEKNHKITKPIKKKKKEKKKQLKNIPPSYILEDNSLLKYWRKRFLLFSKFAQGIQLDRESWFSVTPEKIAIHIANKMEKFDIVVDAFCGSGGNTIQLAKKSKRVIAIDIDPLKIEMARNNAKIYQIDHKIDFIIGNFLQLYDTIKADAIFLSPPWGGPKYLKNKIYNIDVDLLPIGGSELLHKCRGITKNICIYLPKNSDRTQIIKLAGIGQQVEIEQNYFDHNLVALTAYYGDLVTSSK